ncbi:protein FAM204A isoform X2 [Dunckerocampus dactyliophorus]|uniref:protein FAM204A isoform X2 n=1 Tax=Dunckerocampus dactyliophorus TaxID=161453 RepID=UPI002406F308|nr:protein FAM204A isoform X2 [Dunckerocampus dactyliophorus]
MYSGLLPKGLTEDDLSPDDEEDQQASTSEARGSSPGENDGTVLEAHANPSVIDTSIESQACNLPGISQEMWQKFNELREKKEDMKIQERSKRRRRRKGTKSEEPTETSGERQEKVEKHWDGLKQYFGVNDRFHPPASSKPPPKSGLEKSIERAIAEGDIAKAEEMSDRLATREQVPLHTAPRGQVEPGQAPQNPAHRFNPDTELQ